MLHRKLPRACAAPLAALALSCWAALPSAALAQSTYPITTQQRQTADKVAQQGVPLSALAPNAPDSYTIKRGDTLWRVSSLFLKSPWRWPELWGMNKDQIRNPHLIYPGQVLMLIRSGDRAYLQIGRDTTGGNGDIRLSPRVRSSSLEEALATIPQHLIEPFLTQSVVFDTDALKSAPRIVATNDNKVLLTQGDTAYVRGDVGAYQDFRIFRQPQPLLDPITQELLGYEATYVGAAELLSPAGKKGEHVVPATLRVTAVRTEVGLGDRLAPIDTRSQSSYVPHAPETPIEGHIVAVHGDALTAGQNQVVALNKGLVDGMERGHVLSLWKAGRKVIDKTGGAPEILQLPDVAHGHLLVFQVHQRVSYALILNVQEPVSRGDRFGQP
ncbi:LysM peptidoglycan-binding domain-containing protein [Roseateles sp. BYS180W]|uniref:LysM peptidoglycan-binding domain-containing protein n=1 Tax=Roseateles rivi TaxID=3299028 RepID=A0ABW7FWI8_9BURK